MIPNKLLIHTDSNILELVRITKENNYEYKFTRSETKLGMLMTMSEEQLKNNLRKNIIKTIINE
jgi:Tat protein secretion system quality control protein TatD with DNase activity